MSNITLYQNSDHSANRGLAFVPEGLNDRSQAIYCLEQAHHGHRPVRDGMIVALVSVFAFCATGSQAFPTSRQRGKSGLTILIPSLRDGSFLYTIQAMNCLATIIQSLRDKSGRLHFSTVRHSKISLPSRLSCDPCVLP
jgi:hypothetical protein